MIIQNFGQALVNAYDGIGNLFYIFATKNGYCSLEISEIEEYQSSIAHYDSFKEMYENIVWHDWIVKGIKNQTFKETYELYNNKIK